MQLMLVNVEVLGMLGCIDSMLTSVIADNLTRTEHKSDKELIRQGVGNVFSIMFGDLLGACATTETVVNIQAGAEMALPVVARKMSNEAILIITPQTGKQQLIRLLKQSELTLAFSAVLLRYSRTLRLRVG
ncbi:SulP family inorganic anion transporter [Alteromonas sp. P256]|uniref:SulP family inorganic anion transporter n=1 Tax=Alteromonas sp. P256 TaxID=3117399 RepID=UPI003F68B503